MNSLIGKSILIAEDESDLRELFIDIFTAEGAEVVGVENGTLALEALKNKHFDALMTDVRMPGGDGISLIKNINQQLANKPKIFICSAYSDLDEPKIKSLGVIECFPKPFDFMSVINAMKKALIP